MGASEEQLPRRGAGWGRAPHATKNRCACPNRGSPPIGQRWWIQTDISLDGVYFFETLLGRQSSSTSHDPRHRLQMKRAPTPAGSATSLGAVRLAAAGTLTCVTDIAGQTAATRRTAPRFVAGGEGSSNVQPSPCVFGGFRRSGPSQAAASAPVSGRPHRIGAVPPRAGERQPLPVTGRRRLAAAGRGCTRHGQPAARLLAATLAGGGVRSAPSLRRRVARRHAALVRCHGRSLAPPPRRSRRQGTREARRAWRQAGPCVIVSRLVSNEARG